MASVASGVDGEVADGSPEISCGEIYKFLDFGVLSFVTSNNVKSRRYGFDSHLEVGHHSEGYQSETGRVGCHEWPFFQIHLGGIISHSCPMTSSSGTYFQIHIVAMSKNRTPVCV